MFPGVRIRLPGKAGNAAQSDMHKKGMVNVCREFQTTKVCPLRSSRLHTKKTEIAQGGIN